MNPTPVRQAVAKFRPFQNPYRDRHVSRKNIVPSEREKNVRRSAGLVLAETGKDLKSPWLRRTLKRLEKKCFWGDLK